MKRFVVEHHRLNRNSHTGVLSVYQVKRNILHILGRFNIDHRSTCGPLSEAQRLLIKEKLISKKHGRYYRESKQNVFRIQEI
jgi:hypothetical protein